MPRPIWKPTTDEQREAIAAVSRAITASRKAEAAAKQTKAAEREAVERARKVGVPARLLAELGGVGRATVYRRLGKDAG